MNGRPDERNLTAHLAALIAVVLWGLSFIATKVALSEVSPTTIVFTRFFIGSLFLLGILSFRRRGSVRRRIGFSQLLLLAFFGIFVHQMLQVFGLRWTSATNTGWLIGLIPIWAAVLAATFLAERLSRLRVIGLGLGLAGACLIVGAGSGGIGLGRGSLGDLLILISTLNWAGYTVYVRVAALGGSGLQTSAYSMCFGCAMLAVPFVYLEGWEEFRLLSSDGWVAMAFLGVGCSGLAYYSWTIALERLQASRVASYLYLEPFVTQVAASRLLGESVALIVPLAGVLVLIGVFLVQRNPRKTGPAHAES